MALVWMKSVAVSAILTRAHDREKGPIGRTVKLYSPARKYTEAGAE